MQLRAVAPFTGAWIEIIVGAWEGEMIRSLPSRERGLKYGKDKMEHAKTRSLPSRERGLKFGHNLLLLRFYQVAPFTGAWIEIGKPSDVPFELERRSLHGSVD